MAMAHHQHISIFVDEDNEEGADDFTITHEELHPNADELRNGVELGEQFASGCPWRLEEVVGFKVYSLEDMVEATDNFSASRLIGQGSNGEVFHGVIDGKEIAVKRLIESAWEVREEKEVFMKEIKSIGAVNHENILPILGFCLEGRSPLLVTRKLCSLHDALYEHHGNALSWNARFKIAVGVAKGLAYLHTGARRPMLHCDIKPGNILFDPHTMDAYIADFGLVHPCGKPGEEIDINWYYGTVGYWAPEVKSRKRLSTKSDVYSFGKLLYAPVTANQNVHNMPSSLVRTKIPPKGLGQCFRALILDMLYLLPWFGSRRNILTELADSKVQAEINNSGRAIIQVSKALRLIVLCTQNRPELRPSMERVRFELENANSCEIPLTVKAAVFMGLQRLRWLCLLVWMVLVGAQNACIQVEANFVRVGAAMQVYEYVVLGVLFHWIYLTFSTMRWEMLCLVYWSADEDLRLGFKPDNLLN